MAEHSINKYKYNNGDIYLLEDNRITFDNTATTTFLREDGTFAEPDSSIWLLRNSENGNYSITTDRENGYDFGIYAANNETVFTINEDQIAIELHDDNGNTSINTFDPTGIELGVSSSTDAMSFSMNDTSITLNNTSNTSRITIEPNGGVGDGLITLYAGSNGVEVDGDSGITIAGTLYADGSNLTNLNATNLSSGTVNWNRLPTSRLYDANASRTANTVLAAPNGSAGVATFRALVAADIPGLAASKITSGTLDVARGGTAVTSADLIKATYGVEYIVGTQTAATNAWTGVTKSAALFNGKTIAYKLPYAGTSTAATLNLTLSGGGTSGAKNVRINDSNVTTHFPANSVILLVYDGTYWRVDNYDSNTVAVRIYRQNTGYNGDYPLVVSRTGAGSIGTSGTDSSYTNVYGVMWDDTTKVPTLNPSTGAMKVPGGITANLTGIASKATAANITTTANAIAIYSNTTGTFSTKATASGAAYATSANGALTFGTLPAAQGGTGNTSLQATRNAMGLGNTTGALPVANGGTGATSLTSGYAIIGNGTSAVTTRAITNNTATTTALTANTNLVTANTLHYTICRYTGRTTLPSAADTAYTTYMFRGETLNSTATNAAQNGQIAWQYE